ncbi:MAG: hypothetical protein E6Q50_14865 [Lysobacter sp.]|nr:MAG: hypothetical protein E6Q50_14865 [Lysobacter sp.]
MKGTTPLLSAAWASLLAMALFFAADSSQAGNNTYIEAGKTFMLGGEQTAELEVRGRNAGNVPVEFLLSANGKERSIATVAPGKRFDARIPANNIALFRNASDRRAVMSFELTRDVSRLSMRYDSPSD